MKKKDYLLLLNKVWRLYEKIKNSFGQKRIIMSKYDTKSFIRAVEQGDTEQVKSILARNPKAYNTRLFKETEALGRACAYGQTECARVLIEYGADVNRNKEAEWGPLHSACSNGQVACVQLLIDHGAHIDEVTDDFNGCDEQDKTALHIACKSFRASSTDLEACIRLLVKHGANINAQDAEGKTPLHYAYNSSRLIMVLLELGANPHIKDRMRQTVLDEALDTRYRRPNEYCIKLLREYKAQPK